MDELTHLDDTGSASMVDVGHKEAGRRRAIAEAVLVAGEELMQRLASGSTPKGNVYETARIAGIMAAKRTSELVPLCHNLVLDHVAVRFEPLVDRIRIEAEVSTRAVTGVEMEALTAAAVAGLTLYDMLKAFSKRMVLGGVRLLAKSGGQSGDFVAEQGTGQPEDE